MHIGADGQWSTAKGPLFVEGAGRAKRGLGERNFPRSSPLPLRAFPSLGRGKHIVKVCNGTACHVRKSQPIYDAVHAYLGLSGKRKTSDDGLFTLETVACLGACGLAPVMTIDGEVHAKMDPDRAVALLEEIRAKEGSAQ